MRSAGAIAVIDTGREPELMAACLGDLGITRIDLLILTHYDLDHVGGAPAVVGMVSEALVGPSSGADDDYLVAQLAASGARITEASAGMRGVLGDLRYTILWPTLPLRGIEPGNDASITVAFDCAHGCLSSLFLGDLGEHPQERANAVSPIPRVDVVKVAHHGSADQSAETYNLAAATVALIGVGAGNTYGHPTDLVLDLLDGVGSTVFRTDLDGLILLAPGERPGEVRAWTQGSRDR